MYITVDFLFCYIHSIVHTHIVPIKECKQERVDYPNKGRPAPTVIITSTCKFYYVSKAVPTEVVTIKKLVTVGSCRGWFNSF